MASGLASMSSKNYNGRYACHEDDGTGSQLNASFVGGATSTYVVYPEGNTYYSGGTLVLNISALFGDNPCTFSLDTWDSSYMVDTSGIVHEYLNWTDNNDDACWGASFYHEIEGSLLLISQYGAATETKTTANTDLAWIGLDFAGSGDCVLSGAN